MRPQPKQDASAPNHLERQPAEPNEPAHEGPREDLRRRQREEGDDFSVLLRLGLL
jgi:hypothetical protein